MSFNELNTVENFILYKLSGQNLNIDKDVLIHSSQSIGDKKSFPWVYKSASELDRSPEDVLVESELKSALIRINPHIAEKPELAEEIIYKLRALLIQVNHVGLVKANEDFSLWLRGEKTMAFGPKNQHIPIHLIDFENTQNNSFIITNQYRVHARETKIPDIVLLINGIPVVVGETKTLIRPSISWLDGAHEIHEIYENTIPQLFVTNIFSFATEGKELYYGSVRCPLDHWSPWRSPDSESSLSHTIGLKEIGKELQDLFNPNLILDVLQNFAIFSTDKRKKRIKVICRYQQYDATNRIIERVKYGKDKKGLIWHFQGSGKSLLMLFAAGKLRRDKDLKSPTIIILVDRIDLDTQITGTFNAADIPNMIATDSIKELHSLLEQDTRKVIITTIFKFKDAKADMNLRSNIIVLVDEAHRTQEGNLGRLMRAALPNAYLFGLTGTPINKTDKNTFWAFGSSLDESGYLSRYTFQDSIRDNATLKLHFEPRLLNVHVDRGSLDKEYKLLTESANLTDEQSDALSKQAAKMSAFLKSPERIAKITEDIQRHFREKVEPHGFKSMVVTPDREACELYENALKKYFSAEELLVVISTTANDSEEFKKKYTLDKDALEKKIDEFNQANSTLKILIVTAKLLTGFDSPILQTMYLDKSLKDHTLLQAICRTNRLYPQKKFGRIVDYFGLFDDAANALQFDEGSVQKVISNLESLKDRLEECVEKCITYFPNVDRTKEGFEGLESAQECLRTDAVRDEFAKDYSLLNSIWESLSPDKILNQYESDYRWLSGVYQSVRPTSSNLGKLLWHSLGAKTTELIHRNIKVTASPDKLSEFILDSEIIDTIFNNPDPVKVKQLEIDLIKRFEKYKGNSKFQTLSERLEKLKERAEKGLIASIDFIKELCQIARDTVIAERESLESTQIKDAKSALTELFLEVKTDSTPLVVEKIVTEIDEIVKVVRFDGWQSTSSGERVVQQSLRKALLKFKLHKDQSLFERAYDYIKEYY